MSIRRIEDWIDVLKPLGYWDAADAILDDLDDYPQERWRVKEAPNAHREEDKQQLGNALIAWAMLTAIEIEAELGWRTPPPRAHAKASQRAGQDACQTTSLRVITN